MIPLRYTSNLFLRAFCIVYLSAFLSFYFQIPGLYGDNGILPAKSVLENSKHKTFSAKIHYQPTLLWLAPYLGLSTSYALDVLSLLGAFLAFTGLVSQKFCIVPIFTALWSLYFSLYQVGQVFVSSSYDELLLEAGFLAIFVAPFLPSRKRTAKGSPVDAVSLWMVRWLLFRFLFFSGFVKFLSGCPKWWTLTAFNHHFETMPLPSPLSWYSHHLAPWILKLVAVFANFSELILPFLFFIPVRYVRITAFVLELFLQTCIVLTGNFDFSNLLMVTLLLSLLDDRFFFGSKKSNSMLSILGQTLNIALYAGVSYAVIKLYSLNLNERIVEAKIAFTKGQFNEYAGLALPYVVHLGLASLAITVLSCLYQILFNNKESGGNKFFNILKTVFYSIVALTIFFSSTVPLVSLHPSSNSTIHPTIRTAYNRMHKTRIVNQYGLFKQIVGIEGRPEIILEGSNNVEGPWKEYSFLYKPGNVNHSLPFVAPYAPKLDWQMYWAAYSTYDKNPWILSLAHRLLTGKHEVLGLLDKAHSPFSENPPKYIRATLFKYKFTGWSQKSKPAWWIREKVSEYFPAYTKDSPALIDFLKARNLLPTPSKEEVNPILKQGLDSVRYVVNHLEATLLFWSVFTAGLAIIATSAPRKH